MTGGNGQLRALIERILRMKEEARAINDDVREIYAEAKANGFDKTVLGQVVAFIEKRAKDPAAFAERSALFDLYLSELGETGTQIANARPHTHEAITHSTEPAPRVEVDTAEVDATAPSLASAPIPDKAPAEDAQLEDEERPDQRFGEGEISQAPAPEVSLDPDGGRSEPDERTSIQKAMDRVLERRPHCLHPDKCVTSDPRKHCWGCQKAHAEAEGFSA